MSLSGIAQFLVGFIIGVSLLVGSGAAAAYYFFTKLAAPPPRPVFAEERPKPSPVAKPASSPVAAKVQNRKPPQPSPTPSPTAELEPGAYRARVTWSDGLILRDGPSLEANQTGGVAYEQEIIILKESDDKQWQNIRLPGSDQQGWVKAGNVERVN